MFKFSTDPCAILQALPWSGQHQQVCHFSSFVLLSNSCPLCSLLRLFFQLRLSGTSGKSCLLSFPLLSGYNGSPDTLFSLETTRMMSLTHGKRHSCPLQSLVVRIHSCLLSNWRHAVSFKFFDKEVPSVSIEELVLPCHASCALSRFRYNEHSFLLSSYHPTISKIKNPSCSACEHPSQDTSHLTLSYPATDS